MYLTTRHYLFLPRSSAKYVDTESIAGLSQHPRTFGLRMPPHIATNFRDARRTRENVEHEKRTVNEIQNSKLPTNGEVNTFLLDACRYNVDKIKHRKEKETEQRIKY